MSWRGTKKKENYLNAISKMMGTLGQARLYAFDYKKALFRPQNQPKIANPSNPMAVAPKSIAILFIPLIAFHPFMTMVLQGDPIRL